MLDQTGLRNRDRNTKGPIAIVVQDFLNQDQESPFEEEESGADEEELEQLSEELNRVFNYEDFENSTNSQKEKLIQSIIKLGGKNYTVEDLRRDIIKINEEDKLRKESRKEGMRLEEDIDKNNTIKDQNICRNQLDERSEDLVDKVLMELEIKEFSDKGNDRASLSQNFTTSQ